MQWGSGAAPALADHLNLENSEWAPASGRLSLVALHGRDNGAARTGTPGADRTYERHLARRVSLFVFNKVHRTYSAVLLRDTCQI